MTRRCLTAIAFTVLLAGCGSSSPSFTLAASRQCLSYLGDITAQKDLDAIAMEASGGAVGVNMPGNDVSVMFHNTTNDAKRTESELRLFGGAVNAPVDDVLQRDGNVVLEWDNTPTSTQLADVKICLR